MRRRVLISILLVIAATVLTLGVPLSIVSWRVVDDLMRSDLSSRLDSIAASIANQSGSSEVDLGQLEAAVPAGGRLEIRMAGRIDQSIGAPPADQAVLRAARDGRRRSAAAVRPGVVPPDRAVDRAGAGRRWRCCCRWWSAPGSRVLTAGRLVTPLTDVARRAARLGSGDFRTFRRRYGIAELDRVADVLDSSAQDIAALIARERDLAGDISHQLRTRLTGLRLRLEELAEHPDPLVVEEVQEALEQTDRLVTVVDDLLANARSERAAGASEVVLGDELAEIEAEWGPRLVEAGRTLTVRCPRDTMVHATPGRLREAIGVLVENSLRHGAGQVGITVRSTTRGSGGDGGARGQRRGDRAFRRGWSPTSSTGGCRPRRPPVSGWAWRGRSSRPTAADWSCGGRRRRSSRSSWPSVRRRGGVIGRYRLGEPVGATLLRRHRLVSRPADVPRPSGWCRRACFSAAVFGFGLLVHLGQGDRLGHQLRVRGQFLGEHPLAVGPEAERHAQDGADDVGRDEVRDGDGERASSCVVLNPKTYWDRASGIRFRPSAMPLTRKNSIASWWLSRPPRRLNDHSRFRM